MYDFMIKRGPLAAFALGAFLSLLTVIFIFGGEEMNVDFGLNAAKFLFIISGIIAVVYPIVNAMGDPKSLMKVGIGVGAVFVVFLISYMISGNEVTDVYKTFGVDEGSSKVVGGGIIMIYVMAILAVAGIILGEVSRLIK